MKKTLLLIPFFLWGFEPKELSDYPTSIAKDFLIYNSYKTGVNAKEADKLFYQLRRVDNKLLRAYAKRTDDNTFKETARCFGLKKLTHIQDKNCLNLALTPYKVSTLSKKELQDISKKVRSFEGNEWLDFMVEKNYYQRLNAHNAKLFLKVFNNAGGKYRKKYFDKILSQNNLDILAKEKGINRFIRKIVLSKDLYNLRFSLLKLQDFSKLNANSHFYLAINAVKLGKENLALSFFKAYEKKAYYRFDKDKAAFWLYQLTKKKKHLDTLQASFDVNIYTLYANELLDSSSQKTIFNPSISNESSKQDITDPFFWFHTLNKINAASKDELKTLLQDYNYQDLYPMYTFILERLDGYRTNYFITPYEAYLEDYSADKKALLYALARQESRFIPSSISHSFALGSMQIMPFLVRSLAKEQKESIKLTQMLEAKNSVRYAKKHLIYLTKYLQHPLFIAYAYNGGIGFTKRMLKSGLFREGKYEPYLSMELVAYDETRRYGKKVLANYVMYKRHFNEKVTLEGLFQSLTKPSQTDHFRK